MLPEILARRFPDAGLEYGDVPLGQVTDRIRTTGTLLDSNTLDDDPVPGGITLLPDRHAQEDRSTSPEGEQRRTLRSGRRLPKKIDEDSTFPDVLVGNQGDDAARSERLGH